MTTRPAGTITIRVQAAERDELEAAADVAGMKLTAYIRTAALAVARGDAILKVNPQYIALLEGLANVEEDASTRVRAEMQQLRGRDDWGPLTSPESVQD